MQQQQHAAVNRRSNLAPKKRDAAARRNRNGPVLRVWRCWRTRVYQQSNKSLSLPSILYPDHSEARDSAALLLAFLYLYVHLRQRSKKKMEIIMQS
jgi:hypothetical protein